MSLMLFKHDDVAHAALGQHIAVDTRDCAGTRGFIQDAVAADAFVQHGDVGEIGILTKARGQHIRPAAIGVMRGVRAIRNGISERNHGAGVWAGRNGAIGRRDIDAVKKVPGQERRGLRQLRRGGRVAFGEVVVLIGEEVEGFRAHDLRRQIEADGEIGERRDRERNGIGKDGAARRNVNGCGSAKVDGVIAAGLDGAATGAKRDVDVGDGEGIETELVGEAQANLLAAGGDVHDLAHGHAGEETDIDSVSLHGRRGPGSHPLRMRHGLGAAWRNGDDDEQYERNRIGTEPQHVLALLQYSV